jgi:hypothetical protein
MHQQENEDERFERLTEFVKRQYFFVDPERETTKYECTTTQCIEVEINDDEVEFICCDLPDTPRMSNIDLPDEMRELLRTDDFFMGTFGYKNGKWSIIWLSPPYETFEIDEDFEENYRH